MIRRPTLRSRSSLAAAGRTGQPGFAIVVAMTCWTKVVGVVADNIGRCKTCIDRVEVLDGRSLHEVLDAVRIVPGNQLMKPTAYRDAVDQRESGEGAE